jgi:hypothetical protein
VNIVYEIQKPGIKLAFEMYLRAKCHPVVDSDSFLINADGTATVTVTEPDEVPLIAASVSTPVDLPPPVISVPSVAPITTTVRMPSSAPIGMIVDGFKITHYGYPGDSSPDSASMKGIGDRGNKLLANLSVALTKSARSKLFGVDQPSTGGQGILAGFRFQDDDSAPELDLRVDVYDPFYTGIDDGCTPTMYARSKAEMVAAGILPA